MANMMQPRLQPSRPRRAGLVLLMTLLPALVAVREAPCQPVDSIPGVRVSIEVTEILHADPPETAVIDTLVADVPFDLETTLRVGNFVLFLTATPKPPDQVRLQCGLHPFGTATAPQFDEAAVQFGAPLIVDDIAGKGKSTYRALITPEPTRVAVGMAPPLSATDDWQRQSGAHYIHYATPFSLAYFHYPQLHSIIDGEFGAMRDTFALKTPGRASVYVIEGMSAEFPYDPRFDFAVDPARNRIVARYDNLVSGLDAQALLLLGLYRWWGYAPDLLAIGASGYISFADYDVIADRDAGNAIPLDSLVFTRDFKRHDPDVAFHHAASFIGWLIRSQGMNAFRECYKRATDLSLGRALWAGYGRTLAELESEWQAYLDERQFTVEEFYQFATRARYYRHKEQHLNLLEQAAAASDTVRPGIWHDLALAQGHAGLWDDAAVTLQDLVVSRPDILAGHVLLGEAFWALGDRVYAALVLNAAVETDSLLAQAYLRLGDIQADQRRADSAAVLWRRGVATGGGTLVSSGLHLRLGRYERDRGNEEAATEHFRTALTRVNEALNQSVADPALWVLMSASYLALDSIDTALEHLKAARYLADAPVDVSRVHLFTGACYDRLGRRADAVHAYERILAMPAPYMVQVAARRYINRPYRFEE